MRFLAAALAAGLAVGAGSAAGAAEADPPPRWRRSQSANWESRHLGGDVTWICGEDGEKIVGVGKLRVKQPGWKGEVEGGDTGPLQCRAACGAVDGPADGAPRTPRPATITFRAVGGEGKPNGWTVPTYLGEGAEKEARTFKLGRWRRNAAGGLEAEPYEESLGKYRIVRSPHGDVMFTLAGNENWCGRDHESVQFREDGAGGFVREMSFWLMRGGETPKECCARAKGLPFSLSAKCPVRNHIFDGGDAVIDVSVTETAGRTVEEAPLALVVRDWDGREALSRRGTVSLAPHERRTARAVVKNPGRGIFFVELRVGEGESEEFTRTTFAVISPFEFKHRNKSIFGINLRTGRVFKREKEEEYALAARLGMGYIRSGDARLARRFGMTAGVSHQLPKEEYKEGDAACAAKVAGWLDDIAAKEAPIFEFGNEIGHFSGEAERHVLYDRYLGWLDAVIAERARRGMDFRIIYGTSSRRPELVRLIDGKGIFAKLDGFVVHPGRLYWTPDADGGGWKYLGLVRGSKRMFEELGHGGKPVFLTEVYAKSRPHEHGSDSLRQTAENAVLNAALALAEGVERFCAYQLHEGVSFDENGINLKDTEYFYGILNRDNSPKPSAVGYETAAEELDGARFVRELRREGTKLRGLLFDTPTGRVAVLWDRTEGEDERRQGPRARREGEAFFHFEPWLENWRVRTPYRFKAAGAEATIRDVVGRTRTVAAERGEVELELTGAPVFVRGVEWGQF